MISYDANNAKTYILENGNYYITAAKDAHAAINNILVEKANTLTTNVDKSKMVKSLSEKEEALLEVQEPIIKETIIKLYK